MIEPLTPAELDVLAELIAGPDRTNQGIADRIGISTNTVKSHIVRMLAKIGQSDRVGLAVWGVRQLRDELELASKLAARQRELDRWGSERCQHCGRPYDYVYYMADDLWEQITPSEHKEGGLLCIPCADWLCRQKGLAVKWKAETWMVKAIIKKMEAQDEQ